MPTVFDSMRLTRDKAALEADKMIRIRREQGAIDQLRRDITAVETESSKAALGAYRAGELTHPAVVLICQQIDALEAQIGQHAARTSNRFGSNRSPRRRLSQVGLASAAALRFQSRRPSVRAVALPRPSCTSGDSAPNAVASFHPTRPSVPRAARRGRATGWKAVREMQC